jgi:hypothetical protein
LLEVIVELLHDIEGIDPISWWPLATGWWLLIAIATIMVVTLIQLVAFKLTYRYSWKYDTLRKMALLEAELCDATARQSLALLSEYLRRIALQRFPREECASLAGKAWLEWLHAHDPEAFDWCHKGAMLVELPYAPMAGTLPAVEVQELITAAKRWVR